MKNQVKTFGQLGIGTVICFNIPKNGVHEHYVILRHYKDKFGDYTQMLSLETFGKESVRQSTELDELWEIVKNHK